MAEEITIIEAELWRIFTHYSLHSDAHQPETWRITNFSRFAKDCQITSPKFLGAQLDLEIVRLLRIKRKVTKTTKVEVVDKREFDNNATFTITFPIFLELLEIISVRVYPVNASTPDKATALRRLLLENVLLLAQRRGREIATICEGIDEAAVTVVQKDFQRSLTTIFRFYVELADKRRSQELAREGLKTGMTGIGNEQQNAEDQRITQHKREVLRSQHDLIGFKEYMQFCGDYSLRSTSLLTAIQVGDIFLNCVPLDPQTKLVKGMTFGMFSTAVLTMAMVAYKENDACVSAANKTRALLHFMWRAVNTSAKTKNATANIRASRLASYGSGVFCDSFLKIWTADGFPNYNAVVAVAPTTGQSVLTRILENKFLDGAAETKVTRKGARGRTQSTATLGSAISTGSAGEETKDAKPEQVVNPYVEGFEGTKENPVVLHGFVVAALFRTRPELAELVALKLQEMEEHDQDLR